MLPEADMGVTNMAMGGNSGRYAGDETLLVKFFKHPLRNDAKSKEEGRPIFDDVDYVQIMQPGNKDSIVIRPATPMDKDRFAEHFRRYEVRQTEEYIEGTLLSESPIVTRAQCEELSYLNIKTVEQLAEVADSNAQNIMGIQMLKQRAKNYLEQAAGNASAQALADQKAENERLLSLIKDLNDRLDQVEEEKPKPRRKAKKAEEE